MHRLVCQPRVIRIYNHTAPQVTMDESHILRSHFPDIEFPKDRSLPDFVLQNALTYGNRIAFVSISIFNTYDIRLTSKSIRF